MIIILFLYSYTWNAAASHRNIYSLVGCRGKIIMASRSFCCSVLIGTFSLFLFFFLFAISRYSFHFTYASLLLFAHFYNFDVGVSILVATHVASDLGKFDVELTRFWWKIFCYCIIESVVESVWLSQSSTKSISAHWYISCVKILRVAFGISVAW